MFLTFFQKRNTYIFSFFCETFISRGMLSWAHWLCLWCSVVLTLWAGHSLLPQGSTGAPSLVCVVGGCAGLRTWTRLQVVGLSCSAVEHSHSSSNGTVCVVVRSQWGQHLRDPPLCVCRVIKLIHLQLVRDLEHTSSSISSHSYCTFQSYRTSLVQWIRELLRLICGQLLLRCRVALVLNEELVDTIGDMFVDLTH